jgi:hypothetical protein
MSFFACVSNDGSHPPGDLVLVRSSPYRMTVAGGASNLGTIFSFPVVVPEPSALLLAAGGGVAPASARRLRRAVRRH